MSIKGNPRREADLDVRDSVVQVQPPPAVQPLPDEYAANARTLMTWRAEVDAVQKERQALAARDTGLRNKIAELCKRQAEIHAKLNGGNP